MSPRGARRCKKVAKKKQPRVRAAGVAAKEATTLEPSLPAHQSWQSWQSETALHIVKIRIVHKNSRSQCVRPPFNSNSSSLLKPDTGDTSSILAMCRITVREGFRVRYCQGQSCTIWTLKDPDGKHTLLKIQLDDPYEVKWGTLTSLQKVYGLPDDKSSQYKVTIVLESSESTTGSWPPLHLVDGSNSGSIAGSANSTSNRPDTSIADGPCPYDHLPEGEEPSKGSLPPPIASKCRHWRLESSYSGFLQPLTAPLYLTHFLGKGGLTINTDYEMRVMGTA